VAAVGDFSHRPGLAGARSWAPRWGTDGLHDSPLEGAEFELSVPVRQAKLTRSCR
jgi:hypothetical protein